MNSNKFTSKNRLVKNNRLIILIPFAGGNRYSLNSVFQNFDKRVDTISLELPGRGKRAEENLLTEMEQLIDDIYNQVVPLLELYEEYYIFGHSLGALLGFFTSRKIISQDLKKPTHLFVSGRGAPSVREEKEKIHMLPSMDFRNKLLELGGCPKEALDHVELMDFYEPIIRADFKAAENFVYPKTEAIDIPISVFYGSEEDITKQAITHWQNETLCPVEIFEFSGNHFFIFDHIDQICQIINSKIQYVEDNSRSSAT